MRRRGVLVEPVLLRILAVVPLRAGQSEDPLLQDRIPAVPKRERQTERLLVVANAGETIFIPAVGARSGVIVRQGVPGGARFAVILSHCSPGPLGAIRPPR